MRHTVSYTLKAQRKHNNLSSFERHRYKHTLIQGACKWAQKGSTIATTSRSTSMRECATTYLREVHAYIHKLSSSKAIQTRGPSKQGKSARARKHVTLGANSRRKTNQAINRSYFQPAEDTTVHKAHKAYQ